MPKFYVQSGLFQLLVQAHDGEGAALWAVHQFLEAQISDPNASAGGTSTFNRLAIGRAQNPTTQTAYAFSDAGQHRADLDPKPRGPHSTQQGIVFELAATIRCSEMGFGRSDAGEFVTSDVLQKYTELLTALNALGL